MPSPPRRVDLRAALALLEGTPGAAAPDALTGEISDVPDEDHVAALVDSPWLSGVAKLDLLARLEDRVDPGVLRPLRDHLSDEGLLPEPNTRLRRPERSTDALGRTVGVASQSGAPADRDALHGGDLTIWVPHCGATDVWFGNVPGYHIASECSTNLSFEHLEAMLEPASWATCEASSSFFRMMTPQQPRQTTATGWTQIFREVVDFSFGFGLQYLVTDLKFTRIDKTVGTTKIAALTYELHQSIDGQLTVDEGHLIVKDEGPWRLVLTVKDLGFAQIKIVTEFICPIWNYAQGVMAANCS